MLVPAPSVSLQGNDCYPDNQHGFVPGNSCGTEGRYPYRRVSDEDALSTHLDSKPHHGFHGVHTRGVCLLLQKAIKGVLLHTLPALLLS